MGRLVNAILQPYGSCSGSTQSVESGVIIMNAVCGSYHTEVLLSTKLVSGTQLVQIRGLAENLMKRVGYLMGPQMMNWLSISTLTFSNSVFSRRLGIRSEVRGTRPHVGSYHLRLHEDNLICHPTSCYIATNTCH